MFAPTTAVPDLPLTRSDNSELADVARAEFAHKDAAGGSRWRAFWASTLVALTLTGLACTTTPWWNWDMLPYVAVSLSEGDPTVRHATVWSYTKKVVPDDEYAALIGATDLSTVPKHLLEHYQDQVQYRSTAYEDPEAFTEQLPFYSVKPMYPAAIGAWTTGARNLRSSAVDGAANPVVASLYVARAAWVCMGMALFWLLFLRLPDYAAAPIAIGVMALPPIRELTTYSSPDTLSGTFILLGFVFALKSLGVAPGRLPARTWMIASLGVLFLALAARPDNLLLIGPVLLWFLWNRSVRFAQAFVIGAIALAWYLWHAHISLNYGWAVLLHHSFIDYTEFPSQLQPELSVPMLIDLYLSLAPQSRWFFVIGALGTVVAWLRWRRTSVDDPLFQSLLVVFAYMAAHWVLFPDQKDRLMIPVYLVILSNALFLATGYLQTRRPFNQTAGAA